MFCVSGHVFENLKFSGVRKNYCEFVEFSFHSKPSNLPQPSTLNLQQEAKGFQHFAPKVWGISSFKVQGFRSYITGTKLGKLITAAKLRKCGKTSTPNPKL